MKKLILSTIVAIMVFAGCQITVEPPPDLPDGVSSAAISSTFDSVTVTWTDPTASGFHHVEVTADGVTTEIEPGVEQYSPKEDWTPASFESVGLVAVYSDGTKSSTRTVSLYYSDATVGTDIEVDYSDESISAGEVDWFQINSADFSKGISALDIYLGDVTEFADHKTMPLTGNVEFTVYDQDGNRVSYGKGDTTIFESSWDPDNPSWSTSNPTDYTTLYMGVRPVSDSEAGTYSYAVIETVSTK
ncbi:MAG: hypothetical protein ACLFR1_02770 [Spirochaetia bacterium]